MSGIIVDPINEQRSEEIPHPKRILRLVYKFILISIAAHVAGLMIFGGFIIFSRLQPEPVQFEQPVQLTRVEPKKREYKMRVKEQQTRAELLKTLDTVKQGNANSMLIYFGGKDAGHMPEGAKNSRDFTKSDYWFPSGISGRKWLRGSGREIDKIVNELNSASYKDKSSWTGNAKEMNRGGIFFRNGTQY